MSTFDTVPGDGPEVPLGRRAAGGFLDVGAAAGACFVLLDLALSFGAPWPLAWTLGAVGPTLLWAALERRGIGSLGRFASGATVRNLDGSRLTFSLGASGRVASFAYLESGAPMRDRHELDGGPPDR